MISFFIHQVPAEKVVIIFTRGVRMYVRTYVRKTKLVTAVKQNTL